MHSTLTPTDDADNGYGTITTVEAIMREQAHIDSVRFGQDA